jgi:glycosyltransferase involved in cell wall biosynthesis
MRIAIIVGHLHARGGTQRQALELARCLMENGNDVTIFTCLLNRRKCFPKLTNSLKIISVKEVKELTFENEHNKYQLSKFRKLMWFLIMESGLNYYRRYRVMLKNSKELLSKLNFEHKKNPFDAINPHDFGAAVWAANEFKIKTNLPLIWQCNDPLLKWDESENIAHSIFQKWLIRKDKKNVSRVDVITALDTKIASIISDRFNLNPVIVRSGVDIDKFQNLPEKSKARQDLKLPIGKPIILVLTILNSWHRRTEDVINAHSRLANDSILLLVATASRTGGYSKSIEDKINNSDSKERIVWYKSPIADENELLNYYAASDIFVFPNIEQTWGLAVIEAAGAKLPVIVSNGSGSHEVFNHGEEALHFQGGDSIDLKNKLASLIDDENLRNHIRNNGHKMVKQRFSWNRYSMDMLKIIKGAIKS